MRGGISSVRSQGAALLLTIVTVLPACTAVSSDEAEPARRDLAATIAQGLADQIELGPQAGIDYSGLRAVVVTVDGTTVLEDYHGSAPEDTHNLQSVTKSVLSTLVGIAVGDGALRLDDPLAVLLPAYADSMAPATARATLAQVLTMTAGFPARFRGADSEFTFARDWVREILLSADAAPGERFLYSNESAHLVAAILEQATGRPVLEYARTRLFGPLGISTRPAYTAELERGTLTAFSRAGFAWPVDPQGRSTGYSWLKLRPTDLAKIGQLYLDGGRWENEQIVPADWVRDATVNQSEVPVGGANENGYGYLWWVRSAQDHPAFAALGYGGQLVEVVPDLHLVVVTAVDIDYADATDRGVAVSVMTSIVESVIAPAVRDAS